MLFIDRTIRLGVSLMLTVIVAVAILSVPDIKHAWLQLKVNPQVVKLTPPTNVGTGGTGFAVKAPSGQVYTMTNAHICRIAQSGILRAQIEDRILPSYVQVVSISPVSDLCILGPIPGLNGLSVSTDQAVSRELAVVGHPHLEPLTISSGYLTNTQRITLIVAANVTQEQCELIIQGEYDGFGTLFGEPSLCKKTYDSVRTSIVVYPGNSGSPVVNMYGNVVGVLFAANSDNHYGYLVTLKDIQNFLKDK